MRVCVRVCVCVCVCVCFGFWGVGGREVVYCGFFFFLLKKARVGHFNHRHRCPLEFGCVLYI